MGFKETLIDFYDKKYKLLTIIPIILFLIAALSIGYKYSTTGDFLNRGVSLKGGVSISVPSDKVISELDLEKNLRGSLAGIDVGVRKLTSEGKQIGFVIEADAITEEEINSLLAAVEDNLGKLKKSEYSIEQIGSSLGESFFREIFIAIIFTFIFMAIAVFVYFRLPIPCLAVIFAALADMIVTLAIINWLGIKISTAGVAAFLMLIGYSVDTDVLLTARVLKRTEGTVLQRTLGAMRTGMLMTFTTMAAVIIGLIFAVSAVLQEIMIILLVGLIMDIVNTWLTNAGMLRWYAESKMKGAK